MTDVDEVAAFVTGLLQSQLPPGLYFHSLQHTKTVVGAVETIALWESVSKEDLHILRLAAWFHDTGYTCAYEGHEAESRKIARTYLTARSCQSATLQKIDCCIAATHPYYRPENIREDIMRDADMFHLAQPDYWEQNKLLRMELEQHHSLKFDDVSWFMNNLTLLLNHRFHTRFGQTFLEAKKEMHVRENIHKIKLHEQD